MPLGIGHAAPLALGLLWCASGASCRDALPVGPPPSLPPAIHVVFPDPATGTFDRDSNGLVDIEVRWSDSGTAIVPTTLRIVAVEGGVPGVGRDSNLVPGWRVVRLDSAGAVVEETVAGLLREGDTRLLVSVQDTAGTIGTDTTAVLHLPPGAYHQSISLTGMPNCRIIRGVNVALSLDGTKGFVPYYGCVGVFDTDGLLPSHAIPVQYANFASDISVDSATGLAYIGGGPGPGISVLDTRTEQVVRSWRYSAGVANVQVFGSRLFVGQSCTDGSVDVYDLGSLALLGTVRVGAPYLNNTCPNVNDIALKSDGRDGWTAVINTGIVHFDPNTYAMTGLMRLDSGACGGLCWGDARSIRLVGDRWLETARLWEGLSEYDTKDWTMTAYHGDAFHGTPVFKELGLSPDGASLFVSADSGGAVLVGDSIQTPFLFDVPGLRLRYAFQHRRGGTTDAVVWHPDGKRVFMMDASVVDVYIVRPGPN